MIAFGRAIFALSVIALGVETLIFARSPNTDIIQGYSVIPVIPWPPSSHTVYGYVLGIVEIVCGALLFTRFARAAGLTLGIVLFLATLGFDALRSAGGMGGVTFRTYVFEPFALASLAVLIPGSGQSIVDAFARYVLALSLVVFGVDHFFALAEIGTEIPGWIPWHVFWTGFCGIAFIAAGLSFAINVWTDVAAGLLGLMFAIFVFTIYIPPMIDPSTRAAYNGNPDQWCNLFLNIALWGGAWALIQSRIFLPRTAGKFVPSR
jgi:uncharacterized membrane protein